MSTRSDIIVHRADGKWSRVYCHFDGYPEHHGPILTGHYSDQAKAEELVSHGDMSSLDKSCEKPEGHSYSTAVNGYTVYYGRDRGEEGAEPVIGDTLEAAWPEKGTWTEFTYVWFDGKWWLGDPDGDKDSLVLLQDVLDKKAEVKTAIKAPWGVIGHR